MTDQVRHLLILAGDTFIGGGIFFGGMIWNLTRGPRADNILERFEESRIRAIPPAIAGAIVVVVLSYFW